MIEAHRSIVKINWRNFLRAVTIFGICLVCFALSNNYVLALFFLVGSGMADAISVIIRQSVYQAFTPDHLRGRVASVSGIFIRSSNELGAFESGAAAQFLGTVPSVVLGGGITLLTALVMRWRYPRMEGSDESA